MISSLIIIQVVIQKVIFATLSERKVQAAAQRRIGPNYVGYQGLLQPLTDGLKLIQKEKIVPNNVNGYIFVLSPYFFFGISLKNWAVIPLHGGITLMEIDGLSILYTLVLSEISIQGVLYAGYSSNSKYSLLGTLRAIGQKISYSVSLSLCLLCLLLSLGTVDYQKVLNSDSPILLFAFFPLAFILAISLTAELGRSPFDLLEAESELVSGHFTEYSSIAFAFFFQAEYSMMLFMGVLFSVLLLGFSNPCPFQLFLLLLRASYPRIRIDHVISLNWAHILPFLTGYIIFLFPFLLLIY